MASMNQKSPVAQTPKSVRQALISDMQDVAATGFQNGGVPTVDEPDGGLSRRCLRLLEGQLDDLFAVSPGSRFQTCAVRKG